MRILVAMSGGVDSSVVAGLLHEAGHEVIGVTLQLYDHGAATGRKGACCAGQDIHDARRVADQLGIPHYVIDAEQRFADAVIGDFADSYAAGETPVPCMRCNQTVKFTDLTALARGLGAERLATGHYVRRIDGPDGAGTASRRGSGARPELVPVRDHARAAWLRAVSARRHAGQAGGARRGRAARPAGRGQSRTARTSASSPPVTMPIPWCGCARMRGEPGDIVSRDGRVLARHDGIARYTVGQGKRLGAAAVDRGRAAGGRGARPGAAARRRGATRCRHAHGSAARGELAGGATRRGRWRARSSCAHARRRRRRRCHGTGVMARRCIWPRPRCRRLGRPACSTTATGYWAAASSAGRTRRRRLTRRGTRGYLPRLADRMAA